MSEEATSIRGELGTQLFWGILLLPAVFSWLTLRKGYSNRTRIAVFGWLGAYALFAALANIYYDRHQTMAVKTTPTPVTQATPFQQSATSGLPAPRSSAASNTSPARRSVTGLDGELAGTAIKRFLIDNLNDPDSLQDFQVLSITPAKKVPGLYKAVVSYRARNGFGALVLQRQGFVLSEDSSQWTGWSVVPVKN
jgi:hypothetical protein